jgi:phage terminase large subunit-like protein
MFSSKSSQSLLETLARQRLAQLRAEELKTTIAAQANPGDLDILDFIPALNARYERPEHLAQIASLFRRIDAGEQVRALVTAPPQHGKSDFLVNGVARALRRRPHLRNAYVCYGDRLVRKKSRQCRDTARAAGVRLRDDSYAVNDWQTIEGGGLFSTGVGGPLTGNPVDGILVVDDPHKDREDAESALSRERVWEWWTSTGRSRIHPSASVIVSHTRWHPDDLIGRLSKETKPGPDGKPIPAWEIITLPAIRSDGSPLWHLRPLSFLDEQRRSGEYDWQSLWMCAPRLKGEAVFKGLAYYDRLPASYRIGKGADLASTAKTRADYSCGVVLLRDLDEKGRDVFYVVNVKRAQCEVPVFTKELAALDVTYPGGMWHWFCSTTEKGTAQLMSSIGVPVDPVIATKDKFNRAQAVAMAWNEGRVRVPRTMAATLGDEATPEDFKHEPPWLKAFVDELGAFTGVGDRHDDQVDALASAFEAVRYGSEPGTNVGGSGTRYDRSEGGRSFW